MPRAKNGSSTKIGLESRYKGTKIFTHCPQKITQNDISPLDYLGKGTFFLWTTFSGRGQNMVSPKKWLFLGPKSRFLVQKSNFGHIPNFGHWLVCRPPECWFISHLGIDFSTFRSGVTAVFVKKSRLTRQKVFPLPTVGAPSASNSPSFACGLDNSDPTSRISN